MFRDIADKLRKKTPEVKKVLSEREVLAEKLKSDPNLVSSQSEDIGGYLMEDLNVLRPKSGDVSKGTKIKTLQDSYEVIPTAYSIRVMAKEKGLFDVHWERNKISFFSRNNFGERPWKYNLEARAGKFLSPVEAAKLIGQFIVDFHDVVLDITQSEK